MKYLTVIRISVYHIFQNGWSDLQKSMPLNEKHISVKSRLFTDNFSWCARLQLLLACGPWSKALVFESGLQDYERLMFIKASSSFCFWLFDFPLFSISMLDLDLTFEPEWMIGTSVSLPDSGNIFSVAFLSRLCFNVLRTQQQHPLFGHSYQQSKCSHVHFPEQKHWASPERVSPGEYVVF